MPAWVGLVAASTFAWQVLAAEPTGAVRFSVPDRVLLAEYRLLERDAPLILAFQPGRTATAAAALKKLGAQVIGRQDSIGYLFALVPIETVASILELDGLQAVQVTANPMRAMMSDSVEPATAAQPLRSHLRGAPPTPVLTADNPYTAEAATQALAFKSKHREFDGRGVVTAFVEPVAPNLTTMRGALDASGRELSKFARYDLRVPASAAEPVADGLSIWQRTERVTPDVRGAFTWRDRTYRVPDEIASSRVVATQWRMCRRLPARYDTSNEQYDVLWAVDENKVWVLPVSEGTDFSKARSTSLTGSLLTGSLAWVEIGDPAGWRADPLAHRAFVLEADRQRYWLGISASTASHAGMVGSVMAGSGFWESQANGVAPAAQISIFHGAPTPGAPSHTGIEQMLAMLADSQVDVAEASYVLSDTSRFGDSSPYALWAERLLRKSGRVFVKGVGNFGPNLFGAQEFSMAEEVFAVGGYTPSATWRANVGIAPAREHTLWSLSGYGPSRDGGLKPDFLALTQTLSEGYAGRWYWADTPGFEDYGVSSGTSAAAPNGAGHIALLVSAAKQKGLPHDAARLRAAIATSAKFLEGVEARAQGHGLIQVSDAWEALQRAKAWTPASFTVQAPLVGAESKADGASRFVGRGLFELSGWRPGQTGQRELIVTRTGGAARANRYRLRWKGDTRTFSSALREVALPLGTAVSIPVQIEVSASGSYSAILDLIDQDTGLVAGSVLCTILVADPLSANATDGLHYTGASPRPGNSLFYVDVPAGLSMLTVKLTKDGGKSYWSAQDPTGRTMPFWPYGSEVVDPEPVDPKSREQHFSYADPVPGVWQFRLHNIEPYSMEDLDLVENWSQPMPFEITIRGQATDRGLPSTSPAEVLLNPGLEPAYFEVVVELGTRNLQVQIEHAVPDAQVGLYVYKVPQGERIKTTLNTDHTALVYYDPSFQRRKRYALTNPPAGRYRIYLDPIRVPAQGVKVAYRVTARRETRPAVFEPRSQRAPSESCRAWWPRADRP